MGKIRETVLEIAGREVVISNPGKTFFPEVGYTKLAAGKLVPTGSSCAAPCLALEHVAGRGGRSRGRSRQRRPPEHAGSRSEVPF